MDYETAVKTLADWHRESDQPPQKVFSFPDPTGTTVRLIEVTDIVPDTGEVYPIAFGPTPEMPYRTIVAQVTSPEWDAILDGEIELPEGWDLGEREEVTEC